MTINEMLQNMYENKLYTIILIVILLLIAMSLSNLKNCNEYLDSTSTAKTQNTIAPVINNKYDYVNKKIATKNKIVTLKCKYNNTNYYLAYVDQADFNSKLCTSIMNDPAFTNIIKNRILVLVNENNVLNNDNCVDETAVSCLNANPSQDVMPCYNAAITSCGVGKIPRKDTEFILKTSVEDGLDPKTNKPIIGQHYILFNSPDNIIVSLIELSDNRKTKTTKQWTNMHKTRSNKSK